ncbi:IDEAL domain-containing protein [Priestia megaterium]
MEQIMKDFTKRKIIEEIDLPLRNKDVEAFYV